MSGFWFILSGASLMLAAIISDPWGRSGRWAAVFLLGAAVFIIGIAS